MIRAELTKLRSVRAWVVGIAMAFVAIVGLGAAGIQIDCPGGPCPKPPTGPGGEAVRDKFSYVHQRLDGDGELTAHIATFKSTMNE